MGPEFFLDYFLNLAQKPHDEGTVTISNFPMKKLKHKEVKKSRLLDFPGGRVHKNPRTNVKGYGFDPCSRKIPHVTE